MGFLDKYTDKHYLDGLHSGTKKRLKSIESKIKISIDSNPTKSTFEDVIKKHAKQIIDLVGRVRMHFDSWELSKLVSTFKLVLNIGTEVYQIIENMKDSIVADDMTAEEQYLAKLDLGKDLTYFVWLAVDPIKSKWNLIPFKKTIEKMIVKWLAGMALNAAMDFFNANDKSLEVFSVAKSGKKKVYFKAL